eukprot:UC1_evm1s1230
MAASGSDDGTVRLWDVDRKLLKHLLTPEENTSDFKVFAVAFSPDSSMILSGNNDGSISIWDVRCKQCVYKLKGQGSDSPYNVVDPYASATRESICYFSVSFSPDSKMVAGSSNDNTVRLWDMENKRCIITLKEHKDV